MTLVELLVVLVLIGLCSSVVGLSLERWAKTAPEDALATAVAAIRNAAVDSARAVTRIVVLDSVPQAITALPDGTVLINGDAVDRYSGKRSVHAK